MLEASFFGWFCRGVFGLTEPALNQPNSRRFRPFSPLGDVDDNAIPFAEIGDAGSLQNRDMNENVLLAAIPRDEAIAEPGPSTSATHGPVRRRLSSKR
jgi:hypothetical protein